MLFEVMMKFNPQVHSEVWKFQVTGLTRTQLDELLDCTVNLEKLEVKEIEEPIEAKKVIYHYPPVTINL